MKIAFIYDRVNKWGGAERVLLALHEIWPDAPLYTAVYDPMGAPWAKNFRVIPSFLNRLPLAETNHDKLALLMPLAFESFNFDGYDLVISVTSEAAKGIITKPETRHLCYCLTPTRYLWSGYEQYFSSTIRRVTSRPAINYLRRWDLIASQRPDKMVAISKCVRDRIKKYYHRDAEVIYPPIDTEKFQLRKLSPKPYTLTPYFLVVSRLVPYKRVDIAVKAFNRLGLPLKIIGTGSESNKLKKISRSNIEFLGALTDEEVISYYQNCQAVIFPGEEDFGLVPLEAQACGRPVIAYKGGGVLETVIDGKTGRFFWPQTPEALVKIVSVFQKDKYQKADFLKNSKYLGLDRFKKSFKNLVEKYGQIPGA